MRVLVQACGCVGVDGERARRPHGLAAGAPARGAAAVARAPLPLRTDVCTTHSTPLPHWRSVAPRVANYLPTLPPLPHSRLAVSVELNGALCLTRILKEIFDIFFLL